jgi:NAD(P)-dependent dehydrogenase (short-subunit alcohol dehydrogenase family)
MQGVTCSSLGAAFQEVILLKKVQRTRTREEEERSSTSPVSSHIKVSFIAFGKKAMKPTLFTFSGGLTVPAYAAAKHGVAGLTKALSNEWASKGINVNSIAPGYIATEMNSALIANPTRSRQIMERIPAGRWGKPEDFEGAIVFLASSASSYVSGETLVVDGGWMGR